VRTVLRYLKPTLSVYYAYYKNFPERPFVLELPAFLPMAAFIGGILSGKYAFKSLSDDTILLIIATGGLVTLILSIGLWWLNRRSNDSQKRGGLLGLVLIAFSLGLWFMGGVLRFYVYDPHNNPEHLVNHIGHRHEYVARVKTIPSLTRSGKWYRAVLELLYIIEGKDTVSIEGKAMAYVDTFLEPSTLIAFKGRIDSAGVIKGLPDFNMGRWLASNDIYGILWLREFEIIGRNRSVYSFAQELRYSLMQINARFIDSNIVSLVDALTLGYRDELSEEVRESFREAGIIHILAISGLHVGIIYIFLVWTFGFLGRYRLVPLVLSLVAFAFLTGLMPSVVRASIMLVLVELARVMDRKTVGLNILFVTMLIIAFLFPWQVFSIGFWFSALAVLGILAMWIPMSRLFHVEPSWAGWVASMFGVTISAQVFLIPIQILLWQHISVAGLIGNLLAIPLVSVILISTIVLWVVSFWEWFAQLLGVAISYVTNGLVQWSEFVSSLPLNFYFPLKSLLVGIPIVFVLVAFVGIVRRDRLAWLIIAIVITGIWTYFALNKKPVSKPFIWRADSTVIIACPEENVIYLSKPNVTQEILEKIEFYTTLTNPSVKYLFQDTAIACSGSKVAYFKGERRWFDSLALRNSDVWLMDSMPFIPLKSLYSYNPYAMLVLGTEVASSVKRKVFLVCERLEMHCIDVNRDVFVKLPLENPKRSP